MKIAQHYLSYDGHSCKHEKQHLHAACRLGQRVLHQHRRDLLRIVHERFEAGSLRSYNMYKASVRVSEAVPHTARSSEPPPKANIMVQTLVSYSKDH